MPRSLVIWQRCGARLHGFRSRACLFKVLEIPMGHSIPLCLSFHLCKSGQLQSSCGACRGSKKTQHVSAMVTRCSTSPQVLLGTQNQTEPPSHPGMLTGLIKLHFSCEMLPLRLERNSKATFLSPGPGLSSSRHSFPTQALFPHMSKGREDQML